MIGRRIRVSVVAAAPVVAVLLAIGTAGATPDVGGRHHAERTTGYEHIEQFDSTITVHRSGELSVAERITYDFGVVPHHGIYRDIPNRYHYDDRYDRVVEIRDVAVRTDPGTPATFSTSQEDDNLRLKIGDPDRTIVGQHTYLITYRVVGALNAFSDHDELNWNAVGAAWDVPVSRAIARVTVPSDITRVACYAGDPDSRLGCTSSRAAGRSASFTQTSLGPNQAFTVVVGFEPGVVPASATRPILEERWSLARAFSITPLAIGLTIAVVVILVILGVLLARRLRDRRYAGSPADAAYGNDGGPDEPVPFGHREQTPVEFVPFDGLRPGQVGTILDEEASVLDVTATIVDLAVRGYLKIEEIEAPRFLRRGDWRLTSNDDANRDVLLPYERTLLSDLFESESEVELSTLKTKFASKMTEIRKELMQDAVDRGWFVGRPDRQRPGWVAIGVILLVIALGLEVLLIAKTHLALVGIPVVIAALVLILTAGKMPRRTAKGHAVVLHVFGFRRFIEESEQSRAEFAERANLFSEYLPYAIVFGCVDKWANAFAELAAAPDTSWYVGTGPFDMDGFTHGMDAFSTVSSGVLSSTPSSASGSSGFSGGSGGGFGGGGGGSW